MWKSVGYVKASKYRTKVMETLKEEQVKIPSEIAQDTGIYQNHISNTLRQLKDEDLIECINPEVRKRQIIQINRFR